MIQQSQQQNPPTISLTQLLNFSKQRPLAYQSPIKALKEMVQPLYSKSKLPLLPARKICRCEKCQAKGECKSCQMCSLNRCCYNFKCIFDLSGVKPEDKFQEGCYCNNRPLRGEDLEIDWRLMYLFQQVDRNKAEIQSYELVMVKKILYLIETHKNKTIEIYFEPNFSPFLYTERTFERDKDRLRTFNKKVTQSLLKKNILKYLSSISNWEVSNLEEQCEQIIDKFSYSKSMDYFKNKLLTSQDEIVNSVNIKFRGKIHDDNYKSGEKEPDYKGCSNTVNQHLVFYYCQTTKHLWVKNTIYYQQDSNNYFFLRPIQVKFWQGYSLGKCQWFKDKKGDIFSIDGKYLFIYKFHIAEKKFYQIPISKGEYYQHTTSSHCIIYVPHFDRVYCLNNIDLKNSYYIQFYRTNQKLDKKDNENVMNSVSNVTVSKKNIIDKEIRGGHIFKGFYVTQYVSRVKNSDLVPVIYLVIERKNNIIPFTVYIIKIEKETTSNPQEIDITETVSQFDNTKKVLTRGACTVFPLEIEKVTHIMCYTKLKNDSTIVFDAAITINHSDKQRKIKWKEHIVDFTGYYDTRRIREKINNKKPELENLKTYFIQQQMQIFEEVNNLEILHINDVQGISMNNCMRFLGNIVDKNKVCEFYFGIQEGEFIWKIFTMPSDKIQDS